VAVKGGRVRIQVVEAASMGLVQSGVGDVAIHRSKYYKLQ
jgi:hypothetical protein